jgi:hypothetical protein
MSTLKCTECGYASSKAEFRYLYNARIDDSITLRQCPNCQTWIAVDEMTRTVRQKVGPGEAPWGKSAGIEGLADNIKSH